MTYRCFAASPTVYDQVRMNLNHAWGLPNDRGTENCFQPAALALRDDAGRALLCVPAEWCEWEAVAQTLPQLLASGAVEEVSEAYYRSHEPPPYPMP